MSYWNLNDLIQDIEAVIRSEKALYTHKGEAITGAYTYSYAMSDEPTFEPTLVLFYRNHIERNYTGFRSMDELKTVAEMLRYGDYGPALDYVNDLAYEAAK